MSHAMGPVSHGGTRLGGGAFNHSRADDAEAEYDRLRDLARSEASKRSNCFARSQEAYQSGDGAGAKQLSDEGKEHAKKMDAYNKQASDFIFRENNAEGRVPADTIDLHGQFVEEAEDIVEQRIRYAQGQGQTHLHVIVGKGNHSPGHIQKIKPRVEKVCQELGLQYNTEPNEGVLYVNLQGGAAVRPPQQPYQGSHGGQQQYPGGHGGQQQHGGQAHGGYQGQQQHQQQQHQQQQYQQQPQQQQGGDNDELEKLAMKFLPKILNKLEKACCVMM